jgi:hypothetical protein
MKSMIGTVYNILECNLRISQPYKREEVAEQKATLSDSLKELEAARKSYFDLIPM